MEQERSYVQSSAVFDLSVEVETMPSDDGTGIVGVERITLNRKGVTTTEPESIADVLGGVRATKKIETVSAILRLALAAYMGEENAIRQLGRLADTLAMQHVFPVHGMDRADQITAEKLREVCLWYRQ